MTWPEAFRRSYSARGTRAGGPLDPFDPHAVARLDHEAELAIIAALFPEETPDHGHQAQDR
jgi:hypothetical protein